MAAKPKIKLPKTASVGDVVNIKTLIQHVMNSGQRRDSTTGEKIPRMIIHTFEAKFNDKPVIKIDLEGSVSENPFFEFTMKVVEAGELVCTWTDDEGSIFERKKSLAIK